MKLPLLRLTHVLAFFLAALPAARAQNYQQLAAQMDALADQCHAQYVQEMRDSNSSAASRDLAAEQKYRLAAVNIRAQAANAGGGVGGGYAAPSGGSAKLQAINQIAGSLADMAAIMQQSQDRQNAEAQAAQQQAQVDQAERDWQQQIEEGKRALAERQRQMDQQRQLNAAHAQYGTFYKTDDAPDAGVPANGPGRANYDPVADVLGSDGTGYGHLDESLVADVLGGTVQPSTTSDNPTPTAMTKVSPTSDTSTEAASGGGGGSPNAQVDSPVAGVSSTRAPAATEPDGGTGAPLFLGTNLNQSPDAGIKLDGPLDWVSEVLSPAPAPTTAPIREIPPTPYIKLPVETPAKTP